MYLLYVGLMIGARGKITKLYEKCWDHFGLDFKLTDKTIVITIKAHFMHGARAAAAKVAATIGEQLTRVYMGAIYATRHRSSPGSHMVVWAAGAARAIKGTCWAMRPFMQPRLTDNSSGFMEKWQWCFTHPSLAVWMCFNYW